MIDFTRKTQNETYNIVTSTTGEMCGRFFIEQLEQPIVKTEINSSFFNWKAIAASLAAFVSAERISANDVEKNPKTACRTKQPQNNNQMLVGKVAAVQPKQIMGDIAVVKKPDSLQTFIIKGKILDEDSKQPIDGATISIGNEAQQIVYTDTEGNFTFTHKGKLEDKVNISRSFDHETKQFTLGELQQLQTKNKTKRVEIKLKYHRQMMMGMMMIKE